MHEVAAKTPLDRGSWIFKPAIVGSAGVSHPLGERWNYLDVFGLPSVAEADASGISLGDVDESRTRAAAILRRAIKRRNCSASSSKTSSSSSVRGPGGLADSCFASAATRCIASFSVIVSFCGVEASLPARLSGFTDDRSFICSQSLSAPKNASQKNKTRHAYYRSVDFNSIERSLVNLMATPRSFCRPPDECLLRE